MVKVTATIDGLSEADADRLRAGGAGGRYEVVFDYLDGDHHGLELHFRLVEPNPTQQITVGGLGGAEPVMELPEIKREDVVVTFRGGVPEYRLKSRGRLLTDAEVDRLAAQERRRYPRRTIDAQTGIVTTDYPAAELFMARASDLLAAMIGLAKISPLVLGIPSGDDPLSARLYWHLTGTGPLQEEK